MKATRLAIPDVVCFEPQAFSDDRGSFFESFNRKAFVHATGLDPDFVQDNHSVSAEHVVRGLHYQLPPHAQGKLVRVVRGRAFDVAVDIRKSSPTFGRWVGEVLTSENRQQMWVPAGFAHGFLALTDGTEFLYKTTAYYSRDHERCIAWDDRGIGIAWPLEGAPILSPKDAAGVALSIAEIFP